MNEKDIRQLQPKEKRYRVSLGGHLYAEVMPSGRKNWLVRLGNSFHKLGEIPQVSLRGARQSLVRAKAEHADNSNIVAGDLFKDCARTYLKNIVEHQAKKTRDNSNARVYRHLLPEFGHRSINSITGPELLTLLRKIEQEGLAHTAQRVGILYGQIARYAIAEGRCERDVHNDIRGALKPHKHKQQSAITDPKELACLLRAMDGFSGHPPVEIGLRLAPLLALRPSEQRMGVWSEIDFKDAVWRIPAERMKMDGAHVVPLSTQALDLLERLRSYHEGPLMFPGIRTASRPISDNTLNSALRQLGYSGDRVVCHGFRTTFSTLLNEQGYNADWIEAQLAHHGGGVRSVYNAAKYLKQRREMMQDWANYLDGLRLA